MKRTQPATNQTTEPRPSQIDLNLPTVAFVGRVNVGKSTLFNRIMEKKAALVSPIPGTTRTRNIGIFTWRGVQSRAIDAGGLTFREHDDFESAVVEQTNQAIREADVIVFVADIQAGMFPQEREIAKFLHRAGKPVIFVANKADSPRTHTLVHEADWLKLGFGTPFPISAVNGVGVGDLLDDIFKKFHATKHRPKKVAVEPDIRVAIIGKPNVGKSTLLNQIAGEEKVIVSTIPHTTRETFNLLVRWHGALIEFLDTAGIRKRARIGESLEKLGVAQSIKRMDEAHVALIMIDATDPLSSQEKRLAALVAEKRRSVVFVINKWDLIENHSDEYREKFKDALYSYYPNLAYAPLLFISAKTGYRVHQLYDLITATATARTMEIDAKELDQFLRELVSRHKPTRGRGTNYPKIFGLRQIDTDPPTFQLTAQARTSVHPSYLRYVENAIRERFEFIGTPIVIYTKKTKR